MCLNDSLKSHKFLIRLIIIIVIIICHKKVFIFTKRLTSFDLRNWRHNKMITIHKMYKLLLLIRHIRILLVYVVIYLHLIQFVFCEKKVSWVAFKFQIRILMHVYTISFPKYSFINNSILCMYIRYVVRNLYLNTCIRILP